MKIKIMSRQAIKNLAPKTFEENTAVISIADYDDDPVNLKIAPERFLQIFFDDVDNDVIKDFLDDNPTKEEIKAVEEKYHIIREDQALRIAQFYFSVRDKVNVLICQCEHGQSRSAAIAAAFLEYKNRIGIKIFSNDSYYPNKVVFRKVLYALENYQNIINLEPKAFVELMWGKQVLESIDNETISPISKNDFLDNYCISSTSLLQMNLSGIKKLYPKVYDAIPDKLGDFALKCSFDVLELLQIK